MALKTTAQAGAWGTGATWTGGVAPSSTDSVEINHAVSVPAGNTTIAGVLVGASGTLTFPAASSSKLILNNANFEVRGLLTMRPNTDSIIHHIEFINIVEANFVGGGNVVLSTDIGLWVMGAGRVDWQGATKTPWTNATASIAAGATSMTVDDASGWKVGDEIIILPMDEPIPALMNYDFDDGTLTPIDGYMARFERRTLTSVSSNTVGWSGGLTYAHNTVTSSIAAGEYAADSRTWKPFVANITRNVKISGETAKKRAHVLFKNTATAQHNIQYVEEYYMGPRKVDTSLHATRPVLVQGRYALHFHHCDNYTANSIVYGCSIHDIGNRGYVLHNSDNITMSNNVTYNYMESAMWWDEGHITNFCTWEDNLMAGMHYNGLQPGIPAKQISMQLLKGDGNVCRRNVICYGSNNDATGAGGFTWEANSEGVWVFEDCLGFCCAGAALWVWQNTTQNHTILRFDHFNNYGFGISHGAYANSYQYYGGYGYNSTIHVVAASQTNSGVIFKDVYLDCANKQYGFDVHEKNGAGAPDRTNKFIQCVIKNFHTTTGYGFRFLGGGVGGFALPKNLDIINCDIGNNDGREYFWDTTYGFNDGSWLRLQKIGSGTNRKEEQVNGVKVSTSGFADFAPNLWGDGTLGLKCDLYNGAGLTDFKVSRFDSQIYFDSGRPDPLINTNGWHYLISSSTQSPPGSGNYVSLDYTYSMRWTGRLEPHYTTNHQFTIGATGKYRMSIDTGSGLTQIIDKWSTTSPSPGYTTSAPIALTAGTKYSIQIDFDNLSSAAQGIDFYWKTSQMAANEIVPTPQLFPPAANIDPIAEAGSNQTINLPTDSIALSGVGSTDQDGTITTWAWTRVSGPNTPTIVSASSRDTNVTGLIAGTYVFRLTVTDDDGGTDTDDVTITVNAANSLPIVSAGADQSVPQPIGSAFLVGTATDSDGSIVSTLWEKDSGGAANIVSPTSLSTEVSGLQVGTYVFRLTATDDDGGTNFDQITVVVTPAQANVAPTANAGPNKVITLPTASVQLLGSAIDTDGFILSQTWSQVSGPNTAVIESSASMQTNVSGLIAGTYVFQLLVRDNQAATGTATAIVIVNSTAGRASLKVRPKPFS